MLLPSINRFGDERPGGLAEQTQIEPCVRVQLWKECNFLSRRMQVFFWGIFWGVSNPEHRDTRCLLFRRSSPRSSLQPREADDRKPKSGAEGTGYAVNDEPDASPRIPPGISSTAAPEQSRRASGRLGPIRLGRNEWQRLTGVHVVRVQKICSPSPTGKIPERYSISAEILA